MPTSRPTRRVRSAVTVSAGRSAADAAAAARREEFRRLLDRLSTDQLRKFVAVARDMTATTA